MNKLHLEKTSVTPEIHFSADGKLKISGRSIPENSIKFYSPVLEWIQQYAASPSSETSLEIYLEYFNTASAKVILDIFKNLEKLHNDSKSKCKVLWIHDANDEDMQEAGEDYKSAFNMPFEITNSSQ